ncbi:AimR family lysis-lysogeny pheromone receptor [Bacillus pumilus]|uniref:AimR family lysis-lysogeny pheromone receptor n=1 Tax=Bacillus pumilus TaxID=1408 RepID=UPI0024C1F438|nr:AimR family lysis-lysogeny pheromone receptor [Bacillus pumilus]WHX43833.1 AimR family lysis-lysogeny pheromone receptor [Bacillus pumilus]
MTSTIAKDLRTYLRNSIEMSKESQKQVATKLGISSSYLSKFLNGKDVSFWIVHKIINYIDKENEVELIFNYFREGISSKNFPAALEYCYSKQLYDYTSVLAQEYKNKRNSKTQELCSLYSLMLESRFIFESNTFLDNLRNFKTTFLETEIMVKVLQVYYYYLNGHYDLTIYTIDQINDLLFQVNDPFLKMAYGARVDEIQVNIYLKQKTELIQSRKIANRILERNFSTAHNITAYHILGLSYFPESYEQSISYYLKCIELYSKFPDRQAEILENKEEISFLQKYWNKRIHDEFAVSEFSMLLKHDGDLSKYYKDERYNKYALFFDGIKESSTEKLLLSHHYFSKSKDYFRASFPKNELNRIGFKYTL